MNPLALTMRDFAETDLPALADLWVAAWKTTGFPIDFEARRGWLTKHLCNLHAAGVLIVVALGAGAEAGFVSIDPESGYLDQLCVAPSAFRKGVGHALVRTAMRLSPGFVELDVNEANKRALCFYEREGFRFVTSGTSAASRLPTMRMRWEAVA